MFAYLLRRVLLAAASLLVMSFLVFAATNLLPGNPAYAILGKEATPEKVADLEIALGLNKPFLERYLDWLGGMFRFDLGHSVTQGIGAFGDQSGAIGTPVAELIGASLRNTAILATISLVLLIVLSIVLGVLSALLQGKFGDSAIQMASLFFIALPEFVLGALLILIFSFAWPILPPVSLSVTPLTLVLPVATLVLCMMGVTIRLVRVGVLEVVRENYVVTARLRGIPQRLVIRSYVLPNALAPSLQVFAIATGLFVGGMVVVEYLFGYPGLGTGFVSAVSGRDYPVVQAYALVLGGAYIVANLVADLITMALNPRIRAGVGA